MLPHQIEDQTAGIKSTISYKIHTFKSWLQMPRFVGRLLLLSALVSLAVLVLSYFKKRTSAHFIGTILNGSCVSSIQILTSELTGGGLEFPKCQENEQLLCSSRAQTWEHSYYLGELRKNSWHPAVWPLHDFIHPGVSVKHQANSSSRKQSISQNIQTTLHTLGFTPGRLGVGGKRRKCMNGKYRKRRWMSMSQVGSDKKNYTPCHDWDRSHSAVHQDQRPTEHCRALSACLSFLSL